MVKETKKLPESAVTNADSQLRITDEKFQSLYANNVALSISQWDVSILFGEIVGQQEGKAVVLQKVKINMSKELAKVFKLLLEGHLAAYEEANGEIKIPRVMQVDAERKEKPLKKTKMRTLKVQM